VASISELITALDAVLDNVREAEAAIDRSSAAWSQAAAGYAATLAGSTDAADDLAHYDMASRRIYGELSVTVTAAITSIESYRSRLTGSPPPASPQPAAATVASRVANARRELGRGIDRSRTHGRWLRGDGSTVVLASGKGSEWYGAATSFARERGWVPPNLPPNATIDIAKHVEVQFAMRMRAECLTHETIVIDRPVCGRGPVDATWPLTCDKVLAECLPAGASITVVDCNGLALTYRSKER
jgi:nucleic acid/nucleotide deaminase of polymorphic system toxin